MEDRPAWPPAVRAGLIAAVVLVPLVPILVGVAFLTPSAAAPARQALLRPFSSSPYRLVAPARRSPATVGSLVAIVQHATTMRSTPGGGEIAPQPTTTPFGSPAVLLVRRTRPGWLGVLSQLAGNGRLGWIPEGSTTLIRISWRLEVSLATRRLTVFEDGRVRERYTVAVGSPSAPTPTGVFAVTDRLRTGDPSGPYGCCILALSALAPHAIQDWSGGNRIAIHSTTETWSIGQPVSHGCLRLTLAEGRWLLEHVPLGTPTIIRSS